MMTEDVNAAVRGAIAGGASHVLVNDAHGPMRNIIYEQLHPQALLIKGRSKPMIMLEALTSDYDAVMCIGFHARAGARGVMSHTFFGHEIEDMWLNDRPVGEIGLLHTTAAALGVPVVLLSGDDAACIEVSEWDREVTTVPVKRALDRFAAEMFPAHETRTSIQDASQRAITAQREARRPVLPLAPPTTMAIRWQSATVANHLAGIPGVSVEDDRTVSVTGALPDLYRLFGVFIRVAASLTDQAPYC